MDFKPYKNQVYEHIKLQYNPSYLFEDSEFPAIHQSLFRFEIPEGVNPYDIQWLRPYQICYNPQFEIDGFDPKDLHQGIIGNCWFIAAAVNISTIQKYLEIVVPPNQSFGYGYAGIFHFRFWQFGEWVDVVVDDRLPFYNGKLLFCSNEKCPNEFWGPLLEKAYAKLAGCYEYLDGGLTQDAIVDMTGGITEYLEINHTVDVLSMNGYWQAICKAHKMGSLCGANISVKDGNEMEEKLPNGLIIGHAYSITKVTEVTAEHGNFNKLKNILSSIKTKSFHNTNQPINNFLGFNGGILNNNNFYGNNDNYAYFGSKNNHYNNYNNNFGTFGYGSQQSNFNIRLIKLRNPWGHGEWKGDWSDRSRKWKYISDNIKQELGFVNENDGEFWMCFEDFVSNFDLMCIVHLNLNAFMDEILNGYSETAFKWDCKMYYGDWIPYQNAGGSVDMDFWENPQYFITLTNNNYFNYGLYGSNNKTTLIVSLFCKEFNREGNGGKIYLFPKQFHIFRVKNNYSYDNINSHIKFRSDELELVGSNQSIFREVTMRFSLDPGNYVIIPSTYDKNISGKFLLRLFTETNIKLSDVSLLNNWGNNYNGNTFGNNAVGFDYFSNIKNLYGNMNNYNMLYSNDFIKQDCVIS